MSDMEDEDGEIYITISNRTDIGQGWRVACRLYPKSLNAMSRHIAERQRIPSEDEARKLAVRWGKQFNAKII